MKTIEELRREEPTITEDRLEELVDIIEPQLDFDVEVCNFYHDPGRTNCANDDAYPPETSYDLESDPIEIVLPEGVTETIPEIISHLEWFVFTVNGKQYDGEVILYEKDGKMWAEIDPYDYEEDVIEDYCDGGW